MPNTRKILIVDDDAELREALTEQLSLHDEFEAVGLEKAASLVKTAQGRDFLDDLRGHVRFVAELGFWVGEFRLVCP